MRTAEPFCQAVSDGFRETGLVGTSTSALGASVDIIRGVNRLGRLAIWDDFGNWWTSTFALRATVDNLR
jgi:hypothetical protein